MEGKNLKPKNILPSKTLLQIWWKNQSFLDKQKLRKFSTRFVNLQTRFTTNVKGTSLGGKHKRRKRSIENKPRTIKKIVIGSYTLIITLNVNGLNAPTKRHRLLGRWKHMHVCTSSYHITLLDSPTSKLYVILLYC